LNEQNQIVEYIRDATNRLDSLATALETTITLLQERRSALISTAVTGQLEVDVSACEVVTA
jgi:type I restriction enzyme S subunit